ncbi:MAG: group II intron maturase-specific domain-containing protein [Bacillota bacterium]
MKAKLKELTARSDGRGNEFRVVRLRKYIVGWVNYFKIADMKNLITTTDEWMRRRCLFRTISNQNITFENPKPRLWLPSKLNRPLASGQNRDNQL